MAKNTDDELRAQFEAAMNRQASPSRDAPAEDESPPPGPGEEEFRRGTIAGISGKDVFVDLGERDQGVISIDEFDSPPHVGQSFEFGIVDFADDLFTLSRKEARRLESWQALEVGKWVKARVTGTNSGGLEVKVGPIDGFIPISQVDTAQVEADDLTAKVGEVFVCEVTQVDERRDQVVLSRRKVLDSERRKKKEESLTTLSVGKVVRGTVEKVQDFGAFVEIGAGITGLLHVSNISHQRVEDPTTVLKEGDVVEVEILKIEDGGKRISLGKKQLEAHPWDGIEERFAEGRVVEGTVTRLAEFGAFVEIAPGVEGLLHISQLGVDRVRRVESVVKKGERVAVRIQSIDPESKRMSLSRLTDQGVVIGSEDDFGDEVPEAPPPPAANRGTNLGDLLREAMNKKKS